MIDPRSTQDIINAIESMIYTLAIVIGVFLYFYACSADAAGISAAKVKRIAKQAVIQEIGVRKEELRGEPGPPGPQGLPGTEAQGALPFIYAHITPEGDVDESRSDGIYDADVRRLGPERTFASGPHISLEFSYCFTGIDPNGAQVTIDGDNTPDASRIQVNFIPTDHGCNFFVSIFGPRGDRTPGGFFITIY